MDYKKLMMESLSSMLEEGETLRFPFYGSLVKEKLAYFGFFGLTENVLLVALLGRGNEDISSYSRIPLDIKEAHIKKTLIPTGYKITIFTNDNTFCQIQAYKKVLNINCQAENVTAFVKYLEAFPSA